MFGIGTPTRRRGLVNVSSPFTSTGRPNSAATPKKRFSVVDQSTIQIVHQGQKYAIEASNTLPLQVRDASYEGLR
jgi:hypothetical protein